MVLLILAVLWGAVAVVSLRERLIGNPGDSVGSFRHQLRVLQRAAPGYVHPAHVLYDAPLTIDLTDGASVLPIRPVDPIRVRRARTLKRRRDVLIALLAAMGATLVLGLIPAFHLLLGLHLVLDVLFVGYVAMLLRLRNAAAEREIAVRFLPAGRHPEPVLALRRTAN